MFHGAVRVLHIRMSSARLAVLATLYVLAAIVLATAARGGPAGPATVTGAMSLDDIGGGTLLFRTVMPGRYVPAPVIATDVDMRVAGMVARVVVRQQFHNPSGSWLEGVYAFPLPDNAAVDRMRLSVGERVIEAHIAEREAARRTYETARRQGRRAALVEQHRPNIFTNSVANIGPGEAVTVELGYHQTLRYDQGRFRLRFPMVVAPRYFPGPLTTVRAGGDGWASRADAAADAERIASPVLPPEAGPVNPVALRIELDAGFPLAELESPYHRIQVTERGRGRAAIALADGAVPADRDFELVWRPETGDAPVAGLFRETVGGDTYLLAMVLPPHADGDAARPPPRDAVFVIDRSGSMAGTSIAQAKRALKLALGRLRPTDRFDIIRFDSTHDRLFGALRPADAANLARALRYVDDTGAEGGTEMLPALQAALSGRREPKRLRQVVFLTDGAVGNEAQLLREITGRLRGSRLFTVGIGSAPNSYFMRKAAAAGRGTFTHIGKLSEVAARMDGLFRKLERPVLTDLLTGWVSAGGAALSVDAYPRLPPDLYHGEPVALAARLPGATPAADAALRLTGVLGRRQWRHELKLDGARPAEGIAALWGRARIADLMDSLREGADAKSVRGAVVETALRHNLVSRYTSLVAVSKRQARPAEAPLVRRKAPLNLPHGWDYDKVFGDLLLKAAPARLREASLRPAASAVAATPVNLPQGATRGRLDLLIGALALTLAAGMVVWRRRRA